jgi:hypothetical protein
MTVQVSGGEYRIVEGEFHLLLTLHSQADADTIMGVLKSHIKQCFIGRRGNADRPNRMEFVLRYWR